VCARSQATHLGEASVGPETHPIVLLRVPSTRPWGPPLFSGTGGEVGLCDYVLQLLPDARPRPDNKTRKEPRRTCSGNEESQSHKYSGQKNLHLKVRTVSQNSQTAISFLRFPRLAESLQATAPPPPPYPPAFKLCRLSNDISSQSLSRNSLWLCSLSFFYFFRSFRLYSASFFYFMLDTERESSFFYF